MSQKNSNDNIGNRTRDLPVCSLLRVIEKYRPVTSGKISNSRLSARKIKDRKICILLER